jgi:hypothetical protein
LRNQRVDLSIREEEEVGQHAGHPMGICVSSSYHNEVVEENNNLIEQLAR